MTSCENRQLHVSGHPQGNGMGLLNRGWCTLKIFYHWVSHFKTIIMNVCLNVLITGHLLFRTLICHPLFQNKVNLNFGWLFKRGKDNRKTFIGTIKRWLWLVNTCTCRGFTDNNVRTLITGCLKGGRIGSTINYLDCACM